MLKFSPANAKLKALANDPELAEYLKGKRKIYSLDLLSGFSCPFAEKCLSKVHMVDGKRKLKDGPKTEFRCFSASQEATFTNVYKSRKHNFDLLKGKSYESILRELSESLPKNLGICRIHVAGDFFSQDYFDAWSDLARVNPDRLFYAYTKSLNYWLAGDVPENLILTASRGGRLDDVIDSEKLRESVVVFSEEQAEKMGLEIDHDDSHAAKPSCKGESFALLIHGIQPKDTEAAEAIKQLKKEKVKFSYPRT
jgi:hypothetical protein